MRGISSFQQFAFLVALLCAGPATACSLKEVGSLPVSANPDGGIVVQVDLGDGKARPFLVDTGSPQTFVLAHVADDLGLHKGGVPINPPYFVGKDQVDGRIKVPTVKLDTAVVTDAKVDLIPEEQLSLERDDHIDGILGDDVLSLYDVEFDLADGKLNLFERDSCRGHKVYWTQHAVRVPIWYQGGIFFFQVTVDGHEVDATLHTTGASTSMSSLAARSIFKLSLDSSGVAPIRASNEPYKLNSYGYSFQTLKLAELVMPSPHIDIVELTETKSLGQWRLAHAGDGGLVALMVQGYSITSHDYYEDGPMGHAEGTYTYALPQAQSFLAFGTGNMQRLRMFVSFGDDALYISGARAQ